MQKPPLDPDVADTAPNDSVLTAYDEKHLITYLRLLDADAESADWHEVARIVLHLDPEHESDRAGRAFDSHLSRAKWMTGHGYRHLLRGVAPPIPRRKKMAYGRSKAATIRRRRDLLKRNCVPTFECSSEGTNAAIAAYRPVLHPHLQPSSAPGSGGRAAGASCNHHAPQEGLRHAWRLNRHHDQPRPTCSTKPDAFAPSLDPQAGLAS